MDGYQLLRADNPGPMTLEGTNSYLLRGPAGSPAVLVDPGPDDQAHLAALAASGPIGLIVLTHGHADHSAGTARLAELTGAAVRAADPAYARGGAVLVEGEEIELAGVRLRVLATPGHTPDSICLLWLRAGRCALLTGDTVLGRGPSVIAHPEGDLADYLATLRRLRQLTDAENAEVDLLLPGHGPVVSPAADVAELLQAAQRHRLLRLEQVRQAAARGMASPAQIVADVYAGLDPRLRRAAEASVAAQLVYLRGV